jgi:hypothetical protein
MAAYQVFEAVQKLKYECMYITVSTTPVNLYYVRLKCIMNGARFADVAAIQERVTAVLRSIPKEAFADSFQKLYECCQQCVVKDGDYFEGQYS